MYAELSYPFADTIPHAFAHIAAFEERQRRARIDASNRAAYDTYLARGGVSRRWN